MVESTKYGKIELEIVMIEGNHFHFIIWAAIDKVDDNYKGVTYVDVIAKDSKEAVKRAGDLCPGRKYYWINNIVEHHALNKGE